MIGLSVRALSLLVLIALGLVGGLTYAWYPRSEPLPELGPIQHLVQTRVAEEINSQLGLSSDTRSIAIPPIPGDQRDSLRRRLESEIQAARGIEITLPDEPAEMPGLISSTVRALTERWIPELLRDSDRPEAVLAVQIDDLTDDSTSVGLRTSWELNTVSSDPQRIGKGRSLSLVRRSWLDPDYARLTILSWPRLWRFMSWIVLGFGVPLLAGSICRRALARESNILNAAVLLCIAAPGAIGAWALTGFGFGFAGTVVTVVATAITGSMAYLYLSLLEEAR